MSASADDLALFGSDEPAAAPKAQASDDDIAMFSAPSGPPAFMAGKGGGFDEDVELAPTWKAPVNAGKYSAKNADGSYVNPAYNSDPGEQWKIAQTGAALADAAQHPTETITDPAKRRELGRGVSDITTFGLAEKAGNAVGSWAQKHGLDFEGAPNFADTAKSDAEEAPGYRGLGQAAALPLPNLPAEVAGRAIGAGIKGAVNLAGKGADVVAKPVAKVVSKIAEGAEERGIDRVADKVIQGGTRRTRAGLEYAEEKLVDALAENKSLQIAALKGDKHLAAEGKKLGERGASELADMYEAADRASAINPDAPSKQLVGDLHDLPGAAKPGATSAETGPALLSAASDVEPVVIDSARAYHLDQNAIAAETRAAKAEEAIARDHARGVPVNAELKAKFERRQMVKEVAARELRDRADELRALADEAKAKNVPPGGKSSMPEGVEYIPPPGEAKAPAGEPPIIDAKVNRSPSRPPGADLDDVVKKLDSSIKRLSKPTSAGGTTESRAVAEQLQRIRDEFVLGNEGGKRFTPAQFLRREQTAYQAKGWGKAMPGDEAATARIAANREASKAVGDVVIKHVTGMDYATAKAAAEADPTSVAAKLFRANRNVEVANLIETHLKAKVGQNPTWARNLLKYAKLGAHGGSLTAMAGLSHLGHGGLATVGALAHAGITAAPYAARAFDAAASSIGPAAAKVASEGVGIKATQSLSVPIAKLLRAARAGSITRPQLEAMAQQDGVPPEIAANIAASQGL